MGLLGDVAESRLNLWCANCTFIFNFTQEKLYLGVKIKKKCRRNASIEERALYTSVKPSPLPSEFFSAVRNFKKASMEGFYKRPFRIKRSPLCRWASLNKSVSDLNPHYSSRQFNGKIRKMFRLFFLVRKDL